MTKDYTVAALPGKPADKKERLWSLDVLRGAVIVLMALDHVRLFWAGTAFSPTDIEATSSGWFFARWITHFCAPAFVFLAGTSAFLFYQKAGIFALRHFLLTRGIWLIFIELAVITPSLLFDWPWNTGFFILQAIWAIGWGMIALCLWSYLPKRLIFFISVGLIAGHNLLDGISPDSWGQWGWLWKLLHMGESWVPLTDSLSLFAVYPLIPWVGVMALGYCFGEVMSREREGRRQFLLWAGIGLIEAFIIIRFTNLYGDPHPWDFQARGEAFTILSFLNTTKYPPSFLYLCMTLGPAMLCLYFLDGVKDKVAAFFRVFGRVPFFFYVIHFSVINLFAHLWHYFRYGQWFNFLTIPAEQWPVGYEPSLSLMYGVWAIVIAIFYYLCRWYGDFKFRRKEWVWKYL